MKAVICIALFTSLMSCGGPAMMQPTPLSLAGNWLGSLTGRAPCAGDWSSLFLTLDEASRTGTLTTADGQRFPVAEISASGVRRLDVTLPPGAGECQTVSLIVSNVDAGASTSASRFSGDAIGRCCGTIQAAYQFTRR